MVVAVAVVVSTGGVHVTVLAGSVSVLVTVCVTVLVDPGWVTVAVAVSVTVAVLVTVLVDPGWVTVFVAVTVWVWVIVMNLNFVTEVNPRRAL